MVAMSVGGTLENFGIAWLWLVIWPIGFDRAHRWMRLGSAAEVACNGGWLSGRALTLPVDDQRGTRLTVPVWKVGPTLTTYRS